ncbi:sulfite exporter TauE/SafE family protein [Gilvimarinus agarilyticus]|uniref:sulfite exporter TauE/SafE family protein n=1 Tax=Gilvimarinus sp. 2_MG-2023 TaxID=3062666 RepID=UPI001C091EDE|nr:sulfite exporter TauE/SafE family protein [Gilvimarinus sp. 2_MG-2023]MBU2885696.1 sulfite exporter TauE/SafE family protein [Gilvimarinus agarilyticus]MDO6570556.1 sulfite exporter TauE/SafE family protein [Gilvimarinus sp. 2_MG-2023]
MIDQWLFYLLAVPIVLLVGLSKGGFGGGLGSLAVPVLSLAVDPRLAAAVLLPILCSMDLVSLWSFRGKWDKRNLLILFPAAMLGLALGAAMHTYMDANKIRFIVGIMALYFVGHYLWGKHVIQRVVAQKASVARGGFWGAVAGFVSYIAHAGGPPISIYLIPQQLPKTVFVGTTVIFFSVVNYVKLVPYVWTGQLDLSAFYTSLVLLPLVPIGVGLGVWLHHRVSDKWFYGMCYVLLTFAGIKLVSEALLVWFG